MSEGNNIMIDLDQSEYLRAKIKVIGVGGAGCNAIENMIAGNLQGVELIAANTDAQALSTNAAKHKLQLGLRTTKGLGAGSDPEVGRKAADESEQDIIESLKDSEMVFVTCGMGGGTGTGAAPVVAKIAKASGALVVAIVTKPFAYEGKVRHSNADSGIEELRNNVDAIIVIPNQKIYEIIGDDTDIDEAMMKIDQILFNSTRGISDIINKAGKFNVDFADVRTIMRDKGQALMGIGYAEGENRAREAAISAITSPLLDGISIKGAKGLLVNITGGKTIRQSEVQIILNTIQEQTGDDINLIHGIVKTHEDTDVLSVTVIATGFAPKKEFKPIINPPTYKPIWDQETIRQNVNKPVRETVSAGEIADGFKNNHFDRPSKPVQKEDLNIPKGHDIRTYDVPAYLRNGETEYENSELEVNTIFYEEPLIVEEEPAVEEIKLESIQTGVDFMNISQTAERNYFSKMMY